MDDLTIRLDTLGMDERVTVDELGQLIKKMKVEGRASCTVADLLSNLRNLQIENSQDLNPPMFMFQDPGILRDKSSSFSFTSSVKDKESVVDGLKSIFFESVKDASRQTTTENENPNNSPQNLDANNSNSKHTFSSSPWSAMSVESVSPTKPGPSVTVSQNDHEMDELPFLFSFNMGVSSSSSSSSSQGTNGHNLHINHRHKGDNKGSTSTLSPGKLSPTKSSSVPVSTGNNLFSHVPFDVSNLSVETNDAPPTWWNPTHQPSHHNDASNGNHSDASQENKKEDDHTHEEENEEEVLGRCHPGGTPLPSHSPYPKSCIPPYFHI